MRKHHILILIFQFLQLTICWLEWNFILFKSFLSYINFSANSCILKVNNKNTRRRCEICSKFRLKTPKRRQWHLFGVFGVVNVDCLSHFFLVFLCWLWTSKYSLDHFVPLLSFFSMFVVDVWYCICFPAICLLPNKHLPVPS